MRLLASAAVSLVIAGGLLAAGAAVALARPQGGDAKAATTILTGQWEYNTRFGPIPIDSDLHCLTERDVENFNRGICLKRYTCDYETSKVRDGQIALKGTWTDKKGRVAPITADGSYTPESFTIAAKGKTVDGIPMALTLIAKRVSATCPTS
ncbi:DUF3617 domain-containing protein [Caulobacter sp.]|uniref:DUF3617 domain-containing protein n=1 Tax=Caulobacter sp. TaxID=78 RepID=UPI003BB1732F